MNGRRPHRAYWIAPMLVLEALSAIAAVASLLSVAGGRFGWALVLVLSSGLAYLAAVEADQS